MQKGVFKADVTCLRGDATSKIIEEGGALHIQNEFDQTQQKTFPAGSYTFRTLQSQAIKDGKIILGDKSIVEKRNFYLSNLKCFNETERRLINPHTYKVDISDELYDLKMSLINKLIAEIKQSNI